MIRFQGTYFFKKTSSVITIDVASFIYCRNDTNYEHEKYSPAPEEIHTSSLIRW
jgi:hypothetical protein